MLLVKEAVQKYTLFAESPNFLRVFFFQPRYKQPRKDENCNSLHIIGSANVFV